MAYEEQNATIVTSYEGSRRLSNVFWSILVSLGGFGFFLTGLSSFFQTNLLFFSDAREISFIPQGIVLIFYGTVGLLLGIFLTLTVYWDVGAGYNEYNRNLQQVIIQRKGFPGNNRELKLKFAFSQIKSVKIKIKEGLNPTRQILLCLFDNREIPVVGIEQPEALNKIEDEAISIAKHLNIYLETE